MSCIMTSKSLSVCVMTMDADLRFDSDARTTGKDLFNFVCHALGVRESHYFGLQFVNDKGFPAWLKPKRKLADLNISNNQPINFTFLVRLYPEEVTEELIQDVTVHLFFLQSTQAIRSEDIYCNAEEAILLASYGIQAKFGDYDESQSQQDVIQPADWIPARVLNQYDRTPQQWVDHIKVYYIKFQGMTRDQAELEYLRIVQEKLEMWGISFFAITNKKDTRLALGVHAQGLHIYEPSNRLEPKIGFYWHEIKHLCCKGRKFIIEQVDSKSPDFIFFTESSRISKEILDLSTANHVLYLTRRTPDPLEFQQMKLQSREERARHQKERQQAVTRERRLRLDVESQVSRLAEEKRGLQQRVTELQDELCRKDEAMSKLQKTADGLLQLQQSTEQENKLLGEKAAEIEKEKSRILHSARKTEEENKAFMLSRCHEYESIIAEVVDATEKREQEITLLRTELESARTLQLNRQNMSSIFGSTTSHLSNAPIMSTGIQLQSTSPHNVPNTLSPAAFMLPAGSSYGVMPYANAAALGDSRMALTSNLPVPPSTPVQGHTGHIPFTGGNLTTMVLDSQEGFRTTESLSPVTDNLQKNLQDIRTDINGARLADKQTDMDRLREESQQRGETKRSTLRKSKAGSANTRVSIYDHL